MIEFSGCGGVGCGGIGGGALKDAFIEVRAFIGYGRHPESCDRKISVKTGSCVSATTGGEQHFDRGLLKLKRQVPGDAAGSSSDAPLPVPDLFKPPEALTVCKGYTCSNAAGCQHRC